MILIFYFLIVLSFCNAFRPTETTLSRKMYKKSHCWSALPSTPGVYEAEISSTAAVGLFGTCVTLMAAGYIWWTVVIPQKRTEVARSKRSGDISEYLDGLRSAGDGDNRAFERWLMSDWLRKVPGSEKNLLCLF